jgi:hypothetical protein
MSAAGADLRSALHDARTRPDAWIFFITGSIAADGSTGSTTQPILVAAQELAGVARKRGWLRLGKHPFDFGGSDGEYQIGSGGEWRLVRGGRLSKTDPNRLGQPIPWKEPTPWDALSAAEHLLVDAVSEARLFGIACTRYLGRAYQGDSDDVIVTPPVWESDAPLNVDVLVDDRGGLRHVEIKCLDRRLDSWRGTSLYVEYRAR